VYPALYPGQLTGAASRIELHDASVRPAGIPCTCNWHMWIPQTAAPPPQARSHSLEALREAAALTAGILPRRLPLLDNSVNDHGASRILAQSIALLSISLRLHSSRAAIAFLNLEIKAWPIVKVAKIFSAQCFVLLRTLTKRLET
jgi:hypothetical protein